MAPLRAGPWFLAGTGLAAGDLAALAVGFGSGSPPAHLALWLLVLSGMVLLLSAAWRLPGRHVETTRRGGDAELWALVAACFTVGLALGVRGGRLSVASCTRDLPTGERVRVAGLVATYAAPDGSAHRSAPGRRVSRRRVRLREARLLAERMKERGSCLAGDVALHVEAGTAAGLRAGAPVVAAGRWWSAVGGPARRRPGRVRGVVLVDSVPGPASWPVGSRAAPPSGAGPGRRAELRLRAAARLDRRLPSDVSPLARALLLADRDDLGRDLRRRFADAGLAHLLAVSGLHVGILAAGLAWLLGSAPVPLARRWRWPVAVAVTGGYVMWIGAPASAVRAQLLLVAWAVCRARGSPAGVADLLGAAAAAYLVVRPTALLDPSFQLSYAGFGGLVAGAAALGPRPVDRRWRAVAAAGGAWLFTAPVVAFHFGRLAPVAVASGLVCAPLVGLAIPCLLATLVLPGAVAPVAAWAAVASLRLLDAAAAAFASLPGGHGDVAPPTTGEWVALAITLFAVLRLAAGSPGRRALTPLAAALALWIAWPVGAAVLWDRGRSMICVLDVGQGDAVAVRTRGRHWIVMDAGPRFGTRDAGRSVVAPFLRERGARAVDLFVLSHPHLDHMGGAHALLDAFRVGTVLDAAVAHPGRAYGAFLAAVEREGAAWRVTRPGQRFTLDEVEGLVLGPVGPSGVAGSAEGGVRVPSSDGWSRDPNETSVVLRLRMAGGFSVVLAGDAGADEEEELLALWPADSLRATVLKVGHHGSRGSSTAAWLRAVSPELAVISAGEGNRFGHPHPELLARLDSAGVGRVLLTARQGTVCVHVREDGTWRVADLPAGSAVDVESRR